MNLKQMAVGFALATSSAAAFAGATGNVGAFSEYVFRGVEQSGGAAVQGGLDYGFDSGFYVGTWISNTSFAGYQPGVTVSYETDVYAGFTKKWGSVGVDVGAIYYYYRDDTGLNTIEGYVGLLLGAGSIKAYYTPEYFGALDETGDDADGLYITANYPIALSETLALTPQVGYSAGDGPKFFVVALFDPNNPDPDDNYVDYSLTLAKTLDAGFTFSLAVIGTNLEKDDEKIVLGLKKGFDL